ncbi:MAG TPA: phosphopantetheine-binding protein [Abditibacteriaceae bacterium]|jgi:hypothetical protein
MGLEIVELIMRVEEEFEIEIPDSDAEKLETVGALYHYVVETLSANSAPDHDSSSASDEIWNKLCSIFANEFAIPPLKIRPEAHFVYDLDLD